MADQQIQYCTTRDGVRIAFRLTPGGAGTPLLYLHAPGMSLLTPQAVQLKTLNVTLEPTQYISARRIAVFDWRGCGLSDRLVGDMSMSALTLDLEAVVERLGWDQFALLGFGMAGPIAMQYAAAHPERVLSLILRETYARAAEMGKIARIRIIGAALREDWDTYIELMSMMSFPWAPEGRLIEAALKEGVTQDVMRELAAATPTYDASAVAEAIAVRTLVMGREDMPVPSPDMLRQLGAQIRGARVVMVAGAAANAESYRVIDEFLAEVDPVHDEVPDSASTAAFRTVLFTDIVGHTEMMRRLGDARGREVLREHERVTREVLRAHRGSEVKTMGDGFMASFGSVTSAMECAVALQRRFSGGDATMEDGGWKMEERVAIRVGLNAGEPIEEEGDLFGSTVILASRICGEAGAGEILAPEPVRHLLSGKGFVFADRGEFLPKGFEDGVRLFEVRWRE